MPELFENLNSGAEFSACGKYWYALWRIWNPDLPKVMIIGLNPSKANQSKNDNTITKVIKVAKHNGFGEFYMMNLFGVVETKSGLLHTHSDLIGDNDGWLQKIAPECSKIVFAWGNKKETIEKAKDVIKMFPEAYCFAQNKNGSPKHPLYCLDETVFIPFIYQKKPIV